MPHKPGIVLFLAAVLVTWLSIYFSSVPIRVNPTPSDTEFSVPRAYKDLQQIARGPHSTGTPENVRVRNYIAAACKDLGLDTSIQHATSSVSWGNSVTVGNVYNIIARLKGSNSSKSVVVVAHYDSQPNSTGTGDDGANCAAMLETIRVLKTGGPLKNDVLFIFTDDEEDGCIGANAFVEESPLLKEAGVVLNFEGRGNAGSSAMFETNSENGWVVREYARSGAHLNGNSLAYEIYKVLPNNTDYTVFKGAGIAGLNHAYIDGFVNYHSLADKPENMDLNSFQEQSDNMLSTVRHFGNIEIGNTKAPDITFFNVIGGWMIHYPASLNLVFLVFANLLLIACLVIGFTRKQLRLRSFLVGVAAFPIVLVILYFAGVWTLAGLRSAYPLYEQYYLNTYNAPYCMAALTFLGIAIFTLLYQWLIRKFSLASLTAGIVLLEVILLDLLYTAMPTAIYFLCFPLVFSLATCWRLFTGRADRRGWVDLALLFPAFLLLAPLVWSTFSAFALSDQSAFVLLLLGLFLGLSLPILAGAFRESRWLVTGSALACCLIGLVLAQIYKGDTPEQPFKTDLRYLVNTDENKAYWVADMEKPDRWNRQFFPEAKTGQVIGDADKELVSDAPMLPLTAPTLTVQKDTIANGKRMLYLHCQAAPGITSVRIHLDEKTTVDDIIVSGKHPSTAFTKKHAYRWVDYRGVPEEGFDVLFEMQPGKPFASDIIGRSMGLPEAAGFKGYPPGIIPGPGDYSNSTQVGRHYQF